MYTSRYREDVRYTERRGTYHFFGSQVSSTKPQYCPLLKCWDTVGRWEEDNSFDLFRYTSKVPGIFGKQVLGSTTYREVDGYPIDYANLSADPRVYYPLLTAEELNNLAWETAGATNPSQPAISVPTAIGELKDLPDLLRGVPKHFPDALRQMPIHAAEASMMAAANIWFQFGFRPFVRDLRKLAQFVKEVEKLLRALRKLKEDGFITRRAILRTQQTAGVEVHDGLLNSVCNFTVYGQRYATYTEKVWGSCRWTLAGALELPEGSPDLDKRLRAITGGFNVQESLATIWELIPWSWLIDWFLDVQSFLSALQNQLPLQAEGICIMRTTSMKTRYVYDMSGQWLYNVEPSVTGQHYEHGVRKERYPVNLPSGLPTASIPVLKPGQWSILGSLAILKVPKHAW